MTENTVESGRECTSILGSVVNVHDGTIAPIETAKPVNGCPETPVGVGAMVDNVKETTEKIGAIETYPLGKLICLSKTKPAPDGAKTGVGDPDDPTALAIDFKKTDVAR